MARAFAIWITAETGGMAIPSSISFRYRWDNPVLLASCSKDIFLSSRSCFILAPKDFSSTFLVTMLPPHARPSVATLHYILNFLYFNLIFQRDDESAFFPPAGIPFFPACGRRE